MPTYCYRTAEGEIVERFFQMGEAPPTLRVNGKKAVRDFRAEQCGPHAAPSTYDDRIWSNTMAVHPRQVGELRKFYKDRLGYDVPVHADGRVELPARSSRRRREICLCRGFHDFDAGYSDP